MAATGTPPPFTLLVEGLLEWWPYCLAHLKPGLPQAYWPHEEALLPKMQAVTTPSRRCRPPDATSPLFARCTAAAYLYHLLEQLAKALVPRGPAQHQRLNPFLIPIVRAGGEDKGCMVYDHKTKHPGMMVDKGQKRKRKDKEEEEWSPSYLRINLGRDREGERCTEAAHRVVLLATQGPPLRPASDDAPPCICCHLCDNKACLNPHHLAWASQSENNTRAYEWQEGDHKTNAEKKVKAVKDAIRRRRGQRMIECKLRGEEGEERDTSWFVFAVELNRQYAS